MQRKLVIALAAVPLLAACTSGSPQSKPKVSTSAPAATTAPPVRYTPPPTRPQPQPSSTPGFRAPRIMTLPGVEGRLDVYEGDARKLQFSGEACVLDVFLYPTSPGAEPTATYVDARRASDGLDVDRASCIQALLRR
jgi:hypothetical protein